MSKVYELLSSSSDQKTWLLAEMAKSPHSIISAGGTSFQGMDERTSSGVWQHARTELFTFATPAVQRVTSTSSFRLSDLFDGPCSIYIVLPPKRLASHNRWLRLMLTTFLITAARLRKANVPVLCLTNETAQMGRFDDIPKAYAIMRGLGVYLWTFWQDLGQIKATYPEHWSSLLGNSFIQVMAVSDLDTAKYFAALSGQVGGTSQPSEASNSESGGSISETITQSWQSSERIEVNHLFGMPRNQMYVRVPSGGAGFLAKQPYYEIPALIKLVMPTPYRKPPF